MQDTLSGLRQWLGEIAFHFLVNVVLGSELIPRPWRWRGLRAAGMTVSESTVGPAVYLGTRRIVIGPGVQIGPQAFLDGAAAIVLAPGSGIGPRSMLLTGGHEQGDATRRVGRLVPQPIEIGAGTWLGAGVTVLPGVRVGPGCIVGAGAVVVRDCAPNGLYVGSPAVRVRDLDPA